jgi:hypothetical protein
MLAEKVLSANLAKGRRSGEGNSDRFSEMFFR